MINTLKPNISESDIFVIILLINILSIVFSIFHFFQEVILLLLILTLPEEFFYSENKFCSRQRKKISALTIKIQYLF